MIRPVITTDRRGGIAVLRMDDGKANAIQDRFLEDFDRALEGARDADAVVMTGARKIFSAGLDLPALVALSRPAIEALMEHFHETMRRTFLWPAPVVAAVNGHAIAGGCVLAMQADRRVMAEGDAKIGINEVQIGLPLPVVVIETFRPQLSPESLARAAQEGTLFSPAEALEAGLVHAVAPADALEERAVEIARHLASVGRPAFSAVKGLLRRPAADALERARREDGSAWADVWFSDPARRRIGEIVARLKSR
jgi:enoyl-CoA hydratase